ncbi:hypothetical protein TruAng_012258 [Truncatella angustata]|nr:hypothetical protein TruAng_012258 [Truncatella angustata]
MTTPIDQPPGTPASSPGTISDRASLPRTPRKPCGPTTPSRLRQVLLSDIASSPSQVTETDYTPSSPLNTRGGTGKINSIIGAKRPRIEDITVEVNDRRYTADDDGAERALATQEKIKLFQDCAHAIDQVLQKAGTDLYLDAMEFCSFFANRLDDWLTEHRSARRKANAAAPTGEHVKPSYAQVAASKNTSAPSHRAQRNTAADERGMNRTDRTDRPRRKEQEDNRIFVRMDNSRLEPYGVKSTLVRRLGLDYLELREVTRCASGFTLHPRDKPTQAKLLALQSEMIDILKAQKIEEHVVWHHYKLRGCPRKVMTAEGLIIEIDETAVANEAELQTGVRPVRCVLSKYTSDGDAETDWLVSFTGEINRPFRLFAHSMTSYRLRREPRVPQCGDCFSFHGRNYRCGKIICGTCAKPVHEGNCSKPTPKCVNCHGPHVATFEKCPARPKVVKGIIRRPGAEQLREIRQAGDRARSQAFSSAKESTVAPGSGRTEARDDRQSADAMQVEDETGTAHESQQDNNEETIIVCP